MVVLSACGSSDSDSGNSGDGSDGDSGGVDTTTGFALPVPYGTGEATILEGTWVADCFKIDVGIGVGYGKGVITYTGNGLSIVGASYSDPDCLTLVTSFTATKDIVIGNQITSDSGLSAYEIDITTVQGTTILPNGIEIEDIAGITNYVITRVDGDKLYDARLPNPLTVDPNAIPPASTPETRIKALNFDYFYYRL